MQALDAVTEVIPERQAMFSTGFLQASESIPALPPQLTSSSTTYLTFLDVFSEVPSLRLL